MIAHLSGLLSFQYIIDQLGMRGLLEGTTQEDIRTLAGYRNPAVHQSSSSREKAMESRKLSIKLLCLFPDEEEGTIAREKETKEK